MLADELPPLVAGVLIALFELQRAGAMGHTTDELVPPITPVVIVAGCIRWLG